MIIQLPMQIDLPNGNKELITDEENLIDIADKFVGYEYSKIIEDIISTNFCITYPLFLIIFIN